MYSSQHPHQLLGRFLSGAVVYGGGIVLTRGGWIFLLPLFWTRLSPDDYGIIGIALGVQTVLNAVFSLGLHDSVQRYFHEWDDVERPRHIAALWLTSQTWGFTVCLVLEVVGDHVFARLFSQASFRPHIELAVWSAFFSNISFFYQAILRIREEAAKATVYNTLMFMGQAALTLFLVLGMDMGPTGYLLGVFLNAGAWAAFFAICLVSECQLRFSPWHLTDPLRYGLPMVPIGFLDSLAGVLDRYFLDKYVSLRQIGLYNIGNQFGMAFNLVNTGLKTSWLPFLYRLSTERKDVPILLSGFSMVYVLVLTLSAMAVVLLARDFIRLYGDARYFAVIDLVPWFVLVYYIQSMAAALGRGMDLAKKTAVWPLVSAASLIVSVIAMSQWVPSYGVHGALAALGVAALLRVALQIWLSHHFYPRPSPFMRLVVIWILALVIVWFGIRIEDSSLWLSVLLKCTLVLIGAVLMVLAVLGPQKTAVVVRSWLREA
ncbi:MAG: lipopolysaccharide biosynthesis protein [Nitrospira sp.]|nr:lipopolysaccharide biosynthesis protein [Nitrospira sp.]MCP9463390.1 lipopolysaccharide biosynthesis protein [Nitrospira sp.]